MGTCLQPKVGCQKKEEKSPLQFLTIQLISSVQPFPRQGRAQGFYYLCSQGNETLVLLTHSLLWSRQGPTSSAPHLPLPRLQSCPG